MEKTSREFEVNTSEPEWARFVAKWMINVLFGELEKHKISIKELPFPPENFQQLLLFIYSKVITETTGKKILAKMFDTNKNPLEIICEENLLAYKPDLVKQVCVGIVAGHGDKVKQYKSGKEKLFGFFVGQVMDCMCGKAFPEDVNKFLREELAVA